ncbi:hypothetical protein SERLA73DRAFT_108802 [Serpula lacrymans var. lacrymans S7.3]|uniref:DUF1692-domain-containing protein n=2 Tax=Serpula lacrymans var. lacrymans TaxID=341189 RepID=F8PX12_SERL3|nr:uncharacterized protein SERLADRAFT_449635 [Serpula lacrymans var. lacrymans S7.9]EGN99338.1 hypothetical protein SERLA73DRAFT_108802 [Serpula lacrymans var. lacrymans S7.3]EGO24902.1 hypothetical protein SERLADRAFT_449635 [Serpula lacrymans var. lacrymans S7.9]
MAEPSLLDKFDAAVPLAQFDAFPKLPSTYKSRSESRGFITIFITFLAFLLVLNDFGEYIWGWPDYEFSVDSQSNSFMSINVDMAVNMPCHLLSVDLRDVVGDRLYLSKGFRRDGTLFDVGQATSLKEHAAMLSARQALSQSRKSRGLLSSVFRRSQPDYRPTYNYQADGSACRIYGTLQVKKVTANLHITTLGHGYTSNVHVDHTKMNLSHVITEFSFGPYFPDITQPLDYSFEVAKDPFVAYQYFLHVVPTTFIAPRSEPLHTNQYSVTHYTRVLKGHHGTPGIFFKFDLDPMVITIHQRTTSFLQLFIRCVGVIGGVFTCTSYFLRFTTRAVDAVSGVDNTPGLVAAEATGVRRKWGGGHLRARSSAQGGSGRVIRQGNGWVVEGASGSPYASYAGTPMSGSFGTPYTPYLSPAPPSSVPGTPGTGVGLGFGPPAFGPMRGGHSPNPSVGGRASHSHSRNVSVSSQLVAPSPGLSNLGHFPPSPNPRGSYSPSPSDGKKDD